jgi:chaperonin GroEL
MFITTEALVFETPEEESKEAAAGHGHSHGPGGHTH